MHPIIQRFENIKSLINNSNVKIVAVSKTFPYEQIKPLVDYGHVHFGENKVQEALDKWLEIKLKNQNIKLHLIGKLQTNKVKHAVKIFDYIHSVDSMKLATKIADEQLKQNKNLKLFIQVNIGNEEQKSGIKVEHIQDLIIFSKKLKLNIIGLMCIPPVNEEPDKYFKEINILNKKFNLPELSMGMSADYLKAIENFSTYLRIGSSIFGSRN